MREEEKQGCFEESLANFAHDVASGGAIRHLAALGCPTDEIMKRLDFPTPRERVEQAVLAYLLDSGIVLDGSPVPEDQMRTTLLAVSSETQLTAELRRRTERDGEENSYMLCTFGMIRRDREARLGRMLAGLTTREREYLLGIPWRMQPMYHRLNGRMFEIAVCMAAHSEGALEFFFFRTRERLSVSWKGG